MENYKFLVETVNENVQFFHCASLLHCTFDGVQLLVNEALWQQFEAFLEVKVFS